MSVIAAALLFMSGLGARGDVNVPGIPNLFYDNPSLTLNSIVLGSACNSLPASALDLDCNPAFLAKSSKRLLRINLVANDRAGTVNEYRQKIDDNNAANVVSRLTNEHDPVVAKAAASAWYQRDWWAVGILPLRVGYAALSRNPAFPEISANVFKDSELFIKGGWIVSDDERLRVGVQTRFIKRDYVYQQFVLADFLADPSLVKIGHTNIIYVEPGLAYTFDSSGEPTLTATAMNLPLLQNGDTLPFRPYADLGFSTAWTIFDHKYRSAVHYTGRSDLYDVFQRFSYAGIYEWDPYAALTFSIGKDLFALGLNGHIDSIVLGLGFKTEQISPDAWHSAQISTVLFEAGLVF